MIRNSDLSIKEEEVQDLLKSVEIELRRSERREVVWLEVESGPDERAARHSWSTQMRLSLDDVFVAPGPLKLSDLMQLYTEIKRPKLKDTPFNPRIPTQLATAEDIFAIIRRGDLLLHRPYDSFTAVVEFVQTAAEDPDVVAIKQTLYRTDSGSPIIDALALAAERGKQVTAIIELQARFDEKKNIDWARQLEEAGVQVVYGLVGIKTHCKLLPGGAARGGPAAALCASLHRQLQRRHRPRSTPTSISSPAITDFGADAAQLMNLLTGFSVAGVQELIERRRRAAEVARFVVAPMDYQRWVIA